jgi:hypothetical protein
VKTDIDTLSDLGASLTPMSLNLPDGLPVERWKEIGARLGAAHKATQWWIGDWWTYGGHRYGDRVQSVEEWGGLAFQTCQNYGAVAIRFETTRRREALSFSHHAGSLRRSPLSRPLRSQ